MKFFPATLTLIGLLSLPTVALAESLESALRSIAASQVTELTEQKSADGGKYSVGVLKWIIRKDRSNSATYGPLNQGLASRLEAALLQAQTGYEVFPLRIVRKASSVAESLGGMTHLTPEGRARFFTEQERPVRYPLYVGGEKVTPDTFLTGMAKFDPSYRHLTIEVFRFDRDNPDKLYSVGRKVVDVDLNVLADSGESFSLRGSANIKEDKINFVFDNPQPSTPSAEATPDVASSAVTTFQQSTSNLGADSQVTTLKDDPVLSTLPVRLEILYDGVVQEPFFQEVGRSRRLFLPEPDEGQQVMFRLTRIDNVSEARYGVVLRVNGLSTINQEAFPVEDCRRWVLPKGSSPLLIKGFLMINNRVGELPFKVLSPVGSIEKEINYGEQSGQISFTIFREGAGREITGLDKEQQRDRVTRGGLVIKRGASESEARTALGTSALNSRGIIDVGSETRPTNVQIVPAFTNPGIVDSVTITYRPRLAE